jgi:tRNA A37 methylthiotransferase MiaB
VGYPGETQEDFSILKEFVQEILTEWDALFTSHKETHTPIY